MYIIDLHDTFLRAGHLPPNHLENRGSAGSIAMGLAGFGQLDFQGIYHPQSLKL